MLVQKDGERWKWTVTVDGIDVHGYGDSEEQAEELGKTALEVNSRMMEVLHAGYYAAWRNGALAICLTVISGNRTDPLEESKRIFPPADGYTDHSAEFRPIQPILILNAVSHDPAMIQCIKAMP